MWVCINVFNKKKSKLRFFKATFNCNLCSNVIVTPTRHFQTNKMPVNHNLLPSTTFSIECVIPRIPQPTRRTDTTMASHIIFYFSSGANKSSKPPTAANKLFLSPFVWLAFYGFVQRAYFSLFYCQPPPSPFVAVIHQSQAANSALFPGFSLSTTLSPAGLVMSSHGDDLRKCGDVIGTQTILLSVSFAISLIVYDHFYCGFYWVWVVEKRWLLLLFVSIKLEDGFSSREILCSIWIFSPSFIWVGSGNVVEVGGKVWRTPVGGKKWGWSHCTKRTDELNGGSWRKMVRLKEKMASIHWFVGKRKLLGTKVLSL